MDGGNGRVVGESDAGEDGGGVDNRDAAFSNPAPTFVVVSQGADPARK